MLLSNISVMGALVECPCPLAPGTALTLDIVGVGPVTGTVRWTQQRRFGLRFDQAFYLARLAPRPRVSEQPVTTGWHGKRKASA